MRLTSEGLGPGSGSECGSGRACGVHVHVHVTGVPARLGFAHQGDEMFVGQGVVGEDKSGSSGLAARGA